MRFRSVVGPIACVIGLSWGCGEPGSGPRKTPAPGPALGTIRRLHFEGAALRYPSRIVLDVDSDGLGCLDVYRRREHLRLAFELPPPRVQKLLAYLRKTNVEKMSFAPPDIHGGHVRLRLEGEERTHDWVYRTPGNPALSEQTVTLVRLHRRLLADHPGRVVRERWDPSDPINPDPAFAVPGFHPTLIPCVRP